LADKKNVTIDEARILVDKIDVTTLPEDERQYSDAEKLAKSKQELDENIRNIAVTNNLTEAEVFDLLKAKKDIVSDWIDEKSEDTEGLSFVSALCVKFVSINWLHYEIFNFLICLIAIWIISQFTARPSLDMIKGLTFASITPEQRAETRASWNKWDLINTAIIIGVIILFYIYFWN
jgi:predicted XRE-type DNA-binding protein